MDPSPLDPFSNAHCSNKKKRGGNKGKEAFLVQILFLSAMQLTQINGKVRANGKSIIPNVIILKLFPTDPPVNTKFYPNLPNSYTQIEKNR